MVTYTHSNRQITFNSTDPSVNLRRIVHLLADNISQLSILDEMEANEDGTLPTSDGNYYWGDLKYSGYSSFILRFSISENLLGADPFYDLNIQLRIEDLETAGKYGSYFAISYVYTAGSYVSLSSSLMNLGSTSDAFEYHCYEFDDVILLIFNGITPAGGAVKRAFGQIMLSPLVDYFTSEKLNGVFGRSPNRSYGTGIASLPTLYLHNGSACESFTNAFVETGGTTYYAGDQSVASPIAWVSTNSEIPFYGFMKNSEFLYNIYAGSSSTPLSLEMGSRVNIGDHTFVYIDLGIRAFIRLS